MRILVVVLLALGLGCQIGGLRAPVVGTWRQSAPRTYAFADADLTVRLTANDRQLIWEFTNHRRRMLEIHPQELAVCLISESDGAVEPFTLWGAPIQAAEDHPPIQVFPKKFTALRYPVLFRSPLIPFENVRHRVELRFFARWPNRITPYRVVFSKQQQGSHEEESHD